MYLSKYFLPIIKEDPQESEIVSHSLMLRSGMIRRHLSGIYNWLPLGTKVIRNIEKIIRTYLDEFCLEVITPYAQDGDLWKMSGRYDSYGREMLKFYDRNNHNLVLGPTNEEVFTHLAKIGILSYKELPRILYQIQWKFRDEIRPRFGVLRAREFLMKDAYSFDITPEDSIKSYNLMFQIYMKIFDALGISPIAVEANSSEIGGNVSHEFHMLSSHGESRIFYDRKNIDSLTLEDKSNINLYKSFYAKVEDVHIKSDLRKELFNYKTNIDDVCSSKSIEIGQIFNFDDKYSLPMRALFKTETSSERPFYMGSYGIGISRIVAGIIEANHDEDGIIWPVDIAPFKVSIINLNIKDQNCNKLSESLYRLLHEKKVDVLFDDTNKYPGYKLRLHDLIGIPFQIIISKDNAKSELVELKTRLSSEKHLEKLSYESVIDSLFDLLGVLDR